MIPFDSLSHDMHECFDVDKICISNAFRLRVWFHIDNSDALAVVVGCSVYFIGVKLVLINLLIRTLPSLPMFLLVLLTPI